MTERTTEEDSTVLENKNLVELAELYYTARFAEAACRARKNELGVEINHATAREVLDEFGKREGQADHFCAEDENKTAGTIDVSPEGMKRFKERMSRDMERARREGEYVDRIYSLEGQVEELHARLAAMKDALYEARCQFSLQGDPNGPGIDKVVDALTKPDSYADKLLKIVRAARQQKEEHEAGVSDRGYCNCTVCAAVRGD